MARNLDVIMDLAVAAWAAGARSDNIIELLQDVELLEHADAPEADVPPAATAGEPGEFTFGGATFGPKPAKPE